MFLIDFFTKNCYCCSIVAGGLLLLIIAISYIYRDTPKPSKHGSKDQLDTKVIKTSNVTFEMIPTNGIHLHTLCAGDPKNPLVILLHGFPEFWKGWEHQVDDLVKAGFYVMVPDQRGYNLSSKPLNMGDYRMTNLVNDIDGLIKHAGKDKIHLAGHDWGAAVAWCFAILKPERLHKLVIVNVPHPVTFKSFYAKDPEQKKRSSYMVSFQMPYFPQRKMVANDFAYACHMFKTTALPGTYTDENLKAYKLALNDAGTVNCMLNWYRAAFQRPLKGVSREQNKVKVPTLIIWGKKDQFLKHEMAEASLKLCADGKVEYIEEATHWVLHEVPEKVNKLMTNFYK